MRNGITRFLNLTELSASTLCEEARHLNNFQTSRPNPTALGRRRFMKNLALGTASLVPAASSWQVN
jgi:hypothetical protein